jgi:hypothetical protein
MKGYINQNEYNILWVLSLLAPYYWTLDTALLARYNEAKGMM